MSTLFPEIPCFYERKTCNVNRKLQNPNKCIWEGHEAKPQRSIARAIPFSAVKFSRRNTTANTCCIGTRRDVTNPPSRDVEQKMIPMLHNHLSGSIPASIGPMSYLQNISLANNEISGAIPPELGYCMSLQHLNLGGNKLTQSVPVEISRLNNLQLLDLSRNSPSKFPLVTRWQWRSLVTLNLSHNMLSGSITDMNDLIISGPSLRSIDLSYNRLEGPVSDTIAQIGGFKALRNNAGLCGHIPGLPPCTTVYNDDNKRQNRISEVTIVCIGLLVILYGIMYWLNNRKGNKESTVLTSNEFLLAIWSNDGRIAYQKIIAAVEGFDSKYCISAGAYASVYKAELAMERVVAVKKLHAGRDNESETAMGSARPRGTLSWSTSSWDQGACKAY
ncbi:hypothetical protein CRG98_044603 [Punica granatum]|uniref:Uncharacterized protein n=1 Tax=Punica granatum TaxID=22663 RepID=A0A2I0HTH8_PUNGR|nr:hypothetical protein CRG98_044603 [Punica granatum]